ncbi:MAG: queuosine precursor transporter [Vampirovibrionales bacterium]|nr:queuosine precursor transporter [Vampirovibrionales bacterium]
MYWDQFTRRHQVYVCLAAVFVSSLIIANLVGAYLFEIVLPFEMPLLGKRALLSAGIIPFPVTFLLTDLLNEYYGEKGARFITFVGFAMSILVFLYLLFGNFLPVAGETVILPSQYSAFSDNYANMFAASLTAYLIGQLLDIKVFGVFKALTGSRFLWLRATGSTVISQVFDSLIVTSIAFYDNLSVDKILLIAASNYTWKFIVSVGITPFLYMGHMILKRLLHITPEHVEVSGELN